MLDCLPPIPEHDHAHDHLLAFVLQREVGYFLAPGPELDLAVRSPTFRELLRQRHILRNAELVNLTALWVKAGEPVDKPPTAATAYERIEDRGAGGVWGDWETACWYAQSLDEQIGVDVVLGMVY